MQECASIEITLVTYQHVQRRKEDPAEEVHAADEAHEAPKGQGDHVMEGIMEPIHGSQKVERTLYTHIPQTTKGSL